MKRKPNPELSKRIVDRLFTNGSGETATRLVLLDERGLCSRDLGGWCRAAARGIIRDEIRREKARLRKGGKK